MSLINVVNLTFGYDDSCDNIFQDVSFQIDTSWKLGFTGRNGRGKTTFLKLLLGEYEYSGEISSTTEFEYFPFQIDDMKKTGEEIAENLCKDYEEWRLIKELTLLGVNADVLYRPFMTLSNGEQTKVMLAILFLKENSFLLIDEPTNHLDREGREIVAKYLNTKEGFILISHDRSFLDSCTTHTLSINKTNVEIEKGNFSSWWENKKHKDEYELSQNEKLKTEIKHLTKAAKCTANWSEKVEKTKKTGKNSAGIKPDKGYIGHRAAKMMKRSISIEGRRNYAVEDKEELLKNLEEVENLKLSPLRYHSEELFSLENLVVYYGDKIVTDKVNFSVKRGDRVSLLGSNGSGKSSVIKLILGKDISYTGKVNIGSMLKISYVSQDTSYLKGNLKTYAEENNIDEVIFKTILRKLDFSRVQFLKNIENFSDGQKKKVLIAKSLCEQADIYIWDEPLNYIDIYSRMQIEELLIKYSPTMLFVEHDRLFVESVSTMVIKL